MDLPIDVYYSIYKYIQHSQFPIIGCWNISNNSRKAITKLGYDKCPHHSQSPSSTTQSSSSSTLSYKKSVKINTSICDCDICHSNYGYVCCDEYTNTPTINTCKSCFKRVCTKTCLEECVVCRNVICSLCCINCTVCCGTVCFKCNSRKHDCKVVQENKFS